MKRVFLAVLILCLVSGCGVFGLSQNHQAQQNQPQQNQAPLGPVPRVHKPAVQFGIDVDWYAWHNENVVTAAAETAAYARRLHANAISITFPFFVPAPNSSKVYGTSATPTPQQLAIAVNAAHRAGLWVSVRPLLGEKMLGTSRTRWKPADPAAWFRSYERFLKPYLRMAQRVHVDEFIEGTELSEFDTASNWNYLSRWARTLYHGTLACASNWGKVPAVICGGVTETVDAYPPARDATLLASWKNFDSKLQPGTVLTEVGIAAVSTAPTAPWTHSWPVSHLDFATQANWFTAACTAAKDVHLGGIYFWSVSLGKPPAGPTLTNQLSWAPATARAIASCF